MRRVKIENATEKKGSIGTLQCLAGILALHPDHSKYDHQRKVAVLGNRLKEYEGKDFFELPDDDYEWVIEKLRTANYHGLMAGNLILSMENAERVDG